MVELLPEEQLLPVIGLGTIIGLGMGGIQALSRSMYAMMTQIMHSQNLWVSSQ